MIRQLLNQLTFSFFDRNGMNNERIQNDFNEIARLSDCHAVGSDWYDSFLVSMVPTNAASVLEVGCGLGRLTAKLTVAEHEVTGVDLSPDMIERARRQNQGNH